MRFIMSNIFCLEQRLPICLHISRKNLGQMVLCKQFKWTSFAVQHLHQACQWEQTSTRWHKSEMSPLCKPATFFSFRLSVPLELPSISSWILYRERASVVLEYRMAGSFEKLTTWRPHDKKKHTAALAHNGHRVYWLRWGWWELTVSVGSCHGGPRDSTMTSIRLWADLHTERGTLAKAWLGVEDWTR